MRLKHNTLLLCLCYLLVPGGLVAKKKSEPTTLVFPSFLHTMGVRKATKTHLMIYTRNRVKVRQPQGLTVARLSSWDDPENSKDDDEVTGYGVNSGVNMIVFNKSMTSLGFYGKNETGIRKLDKPMGITANAHGDVYLADTGNDRIVRFFNPSKELRFIHAIGAHGKTLGRFNAPRSVALDHDSHLYIADTGNHRIQIFSRDEKVLRWFGKNSENGADLHQPSAIAVTNGKEKWSYFHDAFMAIVDMDGTRIQKFGLDGELLAAKSIEDTDHDSGYFNYLAIDYYSNVWVTDLENHCVHKFDRMLNYLTSFGKKGKGDREFWQPRGIGIYKRFGQVFIAEAESAQYYWIGTDIFDFNSKWHPETGAVTLEFFLTEPSFLTLYVKSARAPEKMILEKKQYFSGAQKIRLDGHWQRVNSRTIRGGEQKAAAHIRITPGIYDFILKVEPTYSSYKYFSKQVETSLKIE
jgi:hypothetical protein